jgi:hypothetical protein
MTRVALVARRDEIVADTPNFHEKKFLYYLSRTDYEKAWGTEYRKPGFGTRVLALFLKIIPKVGPFSALAFKIPTTKTEDMYIKSVDSTVMDYHRLLEETRVEDLRLPNKDCDTGREARAGEYVLADKTYARLLDELAQNNFASLSADLKDNILGFYSNLNAPFATKRNKKEWQKTLDDLAKLKAAPAQGPGVVSTAQAPESRFQSNRNPPSADIANITAESVCTAPDRDDEEVGEPQ